MALENASYVNQLDPSNPRSTDSVAQADDHMRLIKNVLVQTFPNINQPVTSTAAALSAVTEGNLVPTGMIAMWSGAVDAIPAGWALCDGTSGRPDLRNRFILGWGTATVGTSGGSSTSGAGGGHTHAMDTQGAHSHGGATGSTALTLAQLPSHTHTYSAPSGSAFELGTGYTGTSGIESITSANSGASGSGNGHTHTIGSDGTHAHNVTAASDHTHTVTPPYYTLAFIMKV